VSMDGFVTASSLGSGPATVNGISYTEVFYGGAFEFTSAPITLLAGVSSYSQPFTFEGFLFAFADNPLGCNPCEIVINELQLTGGGTVTLNVDPTGESVSFVSETFEFEVPEPASLTFVGLGIALVLWRRMN
jgi:hypothetical protein